VIRARRIIIFREAKKKEARKTEKEPTGGEGGEGGEGRAFFEKRVP
jgi:hypothetical protein